MSIENQLFLLEEQFERMEDDRDDFDEEIVRIPEMTIKEYLNFLEQRSQTEFGKLWTVYRSQMFNLVDEYLNCNPERRVEIRKMVSNKSNVKCNVLDLIEEQGWFIKDKSDESLLRRLIGLLSIADLGYSLATLFTVNDLYGMAGHANIDIQPVLSKIASFSSDSAENIESNISTKEFLETFEPLDEEKWLNQ